MFPMRMDNGDFAEWVADDAPEISRIRTYLENGNQLQLIGGQPPTRTIASVTEFDELVATLRSDGTPKGGT